MDSRVLSDDEIQGLRGSVLVMLNRLDALPKGLPDSTVAEAFVQIYFQYGVCMDPDSVDDWIAVAALAPNTTMGWGKGKSEKLRQWIARNWRGCVDHNKKGAR